MENATMIILEKIDTMLAKQDAINDRQLTFNRKMDAAMQQLERQSELYVTLRAAVDGAILKREAEPPVVKPAKTKKASKVEMNRQAILAAMRPDVEMSVDEIVIAAFSSGTVAEGTTMAALANRIYLLADLGDIAKVGKSRFIKTAPSAQEVA